MFVVYNNSVKKNKPRATTMANLTQASKVLDTQVATTDRVIWINGYIRKDGKQVCGHWRNLDSSKSKNKKPPTIKKQLNMVFKCQRNDSYMNSVMSLVATNDIVSLSLQYLVAVNDTQNITRDIKIIRDAVYILQNNLA